MIDTAQSTDAVFLDRIRSELFSAVIGDVLDVAGYRQQFLPATIRPFDAQTTIVGRAMTVLEQDLAPGQADAEGHVPFGLMIEALDDLKPGEIYICTGSRGDYALFGGLMARRATHLGAAGAILDGFNRDSVELRELGFPLFSTGSYAQDQGVRGHVVDYRCDIEFGNGTKVSPGDILFGDIDGVVVIPQAVEVEIIEAALEKVNGESRVREDLLAGVSAQDVFRIHGIL